jgi:hypothetical protein
MKIDFIRVFGFEPALYGMRNPMDSWADSDSLFYSNDANLHVDSPFGLMRLPESPMIGPKDMELACKLIKRGSEHRKFMRQIMVWVRLKIPRFVWQELDTYKVATTRMSCSTMNKLGSCDLDQVDFECPIPHAALENVNALGRVLRDAKAEKSGIEAIRAARVQLKNDLPEGFLQAAMYTMSYETALTMLLQRESHRLPQWRLTDDGSICQFLMSLPFMDMFYAAATAKREALKKARKLLKQLSNQVGDGLAIEKEDLDVVLELLKETA